MHEPLALQAVTRAADALDLIEYATPLNPLVFLRGGDGIVGVGETLRLTFTGARRIEDAARVHRALAAAARIDDPVGEHGSGLVAFGAFAFDDHSDATSVLVVPQLVYGKRGDTSWLTRIAPADAALPEPEHPRAIDELRVEFSPGAISRDEYPWAVARAVDRLRAGDAQKIVLARDLVGSMPADGDLRSALAGLARRYPDAMTYAVDGLLGASPETLVAARGATFFTRVLAGTAARGATATLDGQVAEQLTQSNKDLYEHRLASESALAALAPLVAEARPSEPFPLRMPNLWHLATDITGTLTEGVGTLDAVAALHPTAAVAGTPRSTALALIREIEGVDRGRYAGPVGWIDGNGGGEWAIALRGAEVQPAEHGMRQVRAFAGAGLVSGSEPQTELAETRIKFRPILDAFGDPLR